MRRSSLALGVLLALSAALNVLLLAGGRPQTPPPPTAPRAKPAPAMAPVAATSAERREVEALEARIRELEAEKRILAEVPAPGGPDRLVLLREKLRRISAKIAEQSPDVNDPSSQIEYSEASLEISRITRDRAKDPRSYVEMLRMIYELALDRPPLPEGQKTLVMGAFDDFAAALADLRADSAGERQLKELDLEGAAIERVRQAIGPDRAEKLLEDPIVFMNHFGGGQVAYATEKTRDQEVLDTWAQVYGLDPGQKEAARTAARAFAADMTRIGQSAELGSPESYRERRSLLQAQIDALRTLEGGWTREQRERFRAQVPREFQILVATVVEEEKK